MTDDDGVFDVEAEDAIDFAQVGAWAIFALGLTPTARHLYTIMVAMINRERGDRDVWPSLELLAVWLGLSRGDKVTPYMDELIAAGAIEKRSRRMNGMKTRNIYRVRRNPPENWAGAKSLKEASLEAQGVVATRKAAKEAARRKIA
jgi:hypothetical protein